MPADDLAINVRQIAGYGPVDQASPTMALLVQLAGLGSAYASISPADLVGTALAFPGRDMAIGGQLKAQSVQGGAAQFSNGAFGLLDAQMACLLNFNATNGSIAGVPIATIADVAATVTSFNFRTGAVMLELGDIICAGGAPIASPRFAGCPTAPTPAPDSSSNQLATTFWVNSFVATLTLDFAPLDSPNFTGVPTAPTAALGSSDGQLATTAFVQNAIASGVAGVASFNSRTGVVVLTTADLTGAGGALIASPAFTGIPAAPTAAPGTNTVQLATTAFVLAAIASSTAGVSSFNTRTGAITLSTADITAAGGAIAAATVASFNGRSGAVNLIANDVSAASGALIASPAFTGSPTAPTPPAADNSTRIATTAFVAAFTGFAPIASPAFTGVPSGPTAAFGTNTTQLATTAFVESAVTGSISGVASFNSRTGAITLLANDLTAAGGALLASPALSGTPSAPTAALGTSTTQLATTAFVSAASAAALAAAQTGVTDGSNAAPGQIGEYVTWTSTAQAVTYGSRINVGAGMPLTAGDWNVWGICAVSGGGGTPTSATANLNINNLNAGYVLQSGSNATGPNLGGMAITPQRANFRAGDPTGSMIIFINVLVAGSGGSPTAQALLFARRVR
jgi:hypothetical protein